MNISVRLGLKRYLKPTSTEGALDINEPDPVLRFWAPRLILIGSLVWVLSPWIGFFVGLTILNLIGFILAVVGLKKPEIGLIGIGWLVTLESLTRHFLLTGGLFRWNTLNYWLLIVILLNPNFILNIKDFHSRVLQLFILLLSLGLLISTGITEGIQDILEIITTFGLVIYFARALRNQANFIWLGLVNGFLGAVGGLVFYVLAAQLPYINPNAFSNFPLVAIFSISLGFNFAKKNKSQTMIFLLLALINFGWIILSASRGRILIGIACFLYLFLEVRGISWRGFILLLGIVLSLVISTFFVDQFNRTLERIEKTINPNLSIVSRTSGRSDLLQAGIELFVSNPLGVGTGSFRQAASRLEILGGNRDAAHSAWVKTLAENGVIGITLLAIFVASFSYVGLKKKNFQNFLFGTFVMVSLATAFISTEFSGKSLWFLAAGAIVILHEDQYSITKRVPSPTDL